MQGCCLGTFIISVSIYKISKKILYSSITQVVSSFKKRLIILSWFMNHIYPKFQIRKKRVEISNFCLYIIWFQRKKKSRAVWLDFLNKVLFLNRWSLNSFRDRIVQKKKENRRKLSNSSTRSMIVDNSRWRKLILRIRKSILLLRVSQKFRGYERCKASLLFRDQRRQVSLSGTKLINLHAILSTFHSKIDIVDLSYFYMREIKSSIRHFTHYRNY